MITHFRVYSDSRNYIATRCGIEVHKHAKRNWRWTDIEEDITCDKCMNKIEPIKISNHPMCSMCRRWLSTDNDGNILPHECPTFSLKGIKEIFKRHPSYVIPIGDRTNI